MRPLLLTLTAAFAVRAAAIVAHTGRLGFYRQRLDSPAAWQARVGSGRHHHRAGAGPDLAVARRQAHRSRLLALGCQ